MVGSIHIQSALPLSMLLGKLCYFIEEGHRFGWTVMDVSQRDLVCVC